jgi:hypothetical protein
MSASDTFGELRSLLNREPSVQAWQLTCALLENMSGAELEDVALPYAAAHTTRWPAHLCRAPKLWLERAMGGAHEPRMAVVRAIIGHLDVSEAQAATLARTTAHAPIEALHLTGCSLPDRALEVLLDAPWGARLGSLIVSSTQVGSSALRVLIERDHARQLHTLDLSDTLGDAQRWRLMALHAERLPALRIFGARAAPIGDALCVPMIEAGVLSGCERLYLSGCGLTARSIELLGQRAPALRALALAGNPLGDASVAFGPDRFPALEQLDIKRCGLPRALSSSLARRYGPVTAIGQ